MARIIDLTTLAKTSIDSNDFFVISNTSSATSKKVNVASLFPSLVTAGTGGEDLWSSISNKNQLNFKGIKSGDTDLLTIATTSDNIVLTPLEAGIDLSKCNNVTSQFGSGVDFTGTITGTNAVTSGGTGLSNIVKGAMLYASAEDTIAATSAMSTNGQLLIGNATTGIPTLATLTGGTNVTITNTAGAISIASSLGAGSAILDLANYNLDLGTAFISADGATSQGLRVTGANAYIGTSGNYHNSDSLNIAGGGIRFGNDSDVNIYPNATTSTTAGKKIVLQGGASAGAAAGGVEINGGTASGTGAGGVITLTAGRDTSGSSDGTILFKTYTGGTPTNAMSIGAEGQDITIATGSIIQDGKGIYMRDSSYSDIHRHQVAPATTDDGTTAIAAESILTGLVRCTPTADRSKATDTASNLISGLFLTADNDSWDFSLINLATDGTSFITLTGGTDVNLVGSMIVAAQDSAEDAFSAGVARFRIRRSGSSTCEMYRIG